MRLHKVLLGLLVAAIMGAAVWLSQTRSNYAKHEAAEREALDILKDLATALQSIKDPQSARSAAGRIQIIWDRLETLIQKVQNLPALTVGERRKLDDTLSAEGGPVIVQLFDLARQAARNAQGEATFVSTLERIAKLSERYKLLSP